MGFLTRSQVEQIIKNAPEGTSPGGIVSSLEAQGHTLEGRSAPSSPGLSSKEGKTTEKSKSKRKGIVSSFTSDVGASFKKRQANMTEILKRTAVDQEQKAVSAGAEIIGESLGGLSDVVGAGVKAGATGIFRAQSAARSVVEEGSAADVLAKDEQTLKDAGNALLDSEVGKLGIQALQSGVEAFEQFKEEHPNTGGFISAIANTADFASNFLGAKAGEVAIKKGIDVAGEAGEQGIKQVAQAGAAVTEGVSSVAGAGADALKPITDVTKRATGAAKEIAQSAGEGISKIPGRIEANTAALKAQREAIEELPEIARPAVRNGVLARDAQLITGTTSTAEKNLQKQMLDATKKFSADRTAKDPASIAGNVLTSRIKELEATTSSIGKRLGNIVKDLPAARTKGIRDEVMLRLRKVPGLEELRLLPNGKLDFKGTRLSGAGSAADRKAIQSAWNDTKGRGGRELHNLRQELFDQIKGEKRGLAIKSPLRDDGINAIRQGISDSLDSVSDGYKALNQEFAKSVTPLNDLKKFFRGLEGAGDDILDEKAGLLMRRLTSNVQSGPQLRKILSEMDEVLKQAGKADDVDLARIQDFFNALNRHYDITKDTGLAGQVKLSTGQIPASKLGVITAAADKLLQTGQLTPEVSRKAFEDLFDAVQGGIDDALPKAKAGGSTAGKVERIPNLPPVLDELQEQSIKQYEANPIGLRDAYLQENKKLINTDEARNLFDGYNGRNAMGVHEASSKVSKDAYVHLLATGEGDKVVFMAGGAGAGKSSAGNIDDLIARSDINSIMDGTAANYKSTVRKIEQAVAAGKTVETRFVMRDPLTAWKLGVVTRAMSKGRVVPISVHFKDHKGALTSILRLADEKPTATIKFIDNTGGPGQAKEVAIDKVREMGNNLGNETLNSYIKQGQDYVTELQKAGKIDDELAKALLE